MDEFVFEMSYEDALQLYEELVDCTTISEDETMLMFKPFYLRNRHNTYTHFFNEDPPQNERELSFEEFLDSFGIVISWDCVINAHVQPKKSSRKAKKSQHEKDSRKGNQGIHPLIRLKE